MKDLIDDNRTTEGESPSPPVALEREGQRARVRELAPGWLVVGDAIAALGAVAASRTVLSATGLADLTGGAGPGIDLRPALFAALAPIAIWILGGYRRGAFRAGRRGRRCVELLFAAIAASWACNLILAAGGVTPPSAGEVAASMVVVPIWIGIRFAFEAARRRVPERIVIVGSGHVCMKVLEAFRRQRLSPVEVLGIVDDDPLPMPGSGLRVLGTVDQLPEVVQREGVERIVLAYSQRPDAEVLEALRACDGLRVDIDVVPRLFDLVPLSHEPAALGWLSLANVPPRRNARGPALALKRLVDLVGATALLVVMAPLMAAIALAIKLDDGGPVLYRQRRMGRDGRPFDVLKFRTMIVDADKRDPARIAALQEGASIESIVAALKSDDDRITRVGRVLRRTSFDEFPQLWNVIRGEMSLVGPRPLRDFEVQALDGWRTSRMTMRPGITGLWQVSGRSDLAWDDRLKLDYDYVRHWSISADFQILGRTVAEVLGGRGAK